MLERLKLINSQPCETLEASLQERAKGQVFILRTCQRTLLLGFNQRPNQILEGLSVEKEEHHGLEAYEFLLQTICGLKSRILGENEIVHQFKEAYGHFLQEEEPNRLIQTVLEKLFKDAKEIRTKHLRNIGLQTYAGISRKIFVDRLASGATVFVLGSGQLAEDFIKISHRRFRLVLCARNQERVAFLKERYNIESLDWKKRDQLAEAKNILNTIGTEEPLFERELAGFECLVDLGEPSPFNSLKGAKGFFSLEDIFTLGKSHSTTKEQKVATAKLAITEKTKHRQGHFTVRIPNGWDELLFA